MSTARHHTEWLSLVEVSGPFLSLPVLLRVFPQGLDAHDAEHARSLRMAYGEWRENQAGAKASAAVHDAWVRFVLAETLGLDERVLVEGQAVPQSLQVVVPEHNETLRPDRIVRNPKGDADEGEPRLLIQAYPSDQDLRKPVRGRSWKAWPESRMADLLHGTGVRLGLLTNGEQWMLVDAPKGETTGFASWFGHLWFEEPVTLRAFRSLLGIRRFFGVAEKDTPEAMLAESATNQQDVTDQLGYQVRRAVEVLIRSLDRADQDHGRKLLADVPPERLYEAALTVMMRLVFLFSAEEKGLLRLGDSLYDQHYAVSTLRAQLEDSSKFGEEVMERRLDAWCRLLSTFRAVYSGIDHERLRLPAYGGHLFDPDRFPFLEGRAEGTSWKEIKDRANPPVPLPVDNRTVLHLLNALQVLTMKVAGGGTAARKLSFRALDVTQIGHVYEGLLDHTARRAEQTMLGLVGSKDLEPEVPLAELERLKEKGEDELVKALKEMTGRSPSALQKALNGAIDGLDAGRLHAACSNDEDLFRRIRPFAGLLRLDTFGYPMVIRRGSVFMTEGTDRRSSGTHYTPRSLTEPIVQYTLEPLVYHGPAEGLPREKWTLRSARELLDLKVCDMACGSGAFLVEADRYLADRLMEAWDESDRKAQAGEQGDLFTQKDRLPAPIVRITPYGEPSRGDLFEQVIPLDPDERQTFARRIVAQRCLYGVDKNRLAAEMAKLSLWLFTLAKDKPFTFLDHAVRPGDSLVGVNAEQLKTFSLDGKGVGVTLPNFLNMVPKIMEATRLLRIRLEKIADEKISDVEEKERLFANIRSQTKRLSYAADRLMAASWKPAKAVERTALLKESLREVDDRIRDVDPDALEAEGRASREAVGCPQPFHWGLEFPEVFLDRGGFDAFVGNPPFQYGTLASTALSKFYLDYIQIQFHNWHGKSDLVGAFIRKAEQLSNPAGYMGFIATASLVRGETVESSIVPILANGSVLYRATTPRPWPGNASVTIVDVWLAKGAWQGESYLDEHLVDEIGPDLEPNPEGLAGLRELHEKTPEGMMGIKLSPGNISIRREQRAMLSTAAQAALLPAVGGHELYQCVDVFDAEYSLDPDKTTIGILDEIKRELRKPLDFDEIKHSRPAQKLMEALITSSYAFACAETCHVQLAFVRIPTCGLLPKHTSFVFPSSGWWIFAVLQSSAHNEWFLKYGIRRKGSPRYSAKRCAATFPLPDDSAMAPGNRGQRTLAHLAQDYHDHREHCVRSFAEGVTTIYNRFHDPDESAADIQRLRDLHVEMDRAVAAAYGWPDLDLGHGFHETKQGLRFTIGEPARREVLARLLRLNHERYAEEVAQGLHDKKKAKSPSGKWGKSKASSDGPGLFAEEG